MEETAITIYDVAREANVSMATVSRVVNGNPNVREATRAKVLEVIDRLDYRPNAVARGLASKKTTTIGVVIPDISDTYFATLARGIDDIATMYKYNAIIANSDSDDKKEVHVVNNLLAKQVDGVIFMGNRITDSVRAEFSRSRTPVVLAGTVDGDEQFASVNIDYVSASREAVNQLAKSNKKVAFLSGPLVDEINGQRLAGYKEALKENKLKYTEALIFESKYSYEDGIAIAERIKNSGATAAYVANDELAVGLLNGLLDLGLEIPEDFEIITSNNSPVTNYTRPSISSIEQPLYDIGAVAMRLLTKLMGKEEIEEKTVILPHGIVEKNTTK
ncbi:catabolite control protein A [Floricoccus tropicus]|uniref:Catabolite control protein A n=1 Tax=Floricoccus tropicus TaxID=1859473 RepID=A0A1E8GMN3_9LACT|nr:catabolite control protein A [Floricoccus tropicus]OFI49437.1 catabolite control protein A [Floricoccus tropicus]